MASKDEEHSFGSADLTGDTHDAEPDAAALRAEAEHSDASVYELRALVANFSTPPDGLISAAKAAGYTGQLVMASSQLPGDASEVLDVLDRGENPPYKRVIAATATVRECKRNHKGSLIKRMLFSHT